MTGEEIENLADECYKDLQSHERVLTVLMTRKSLIQANKEDFLRKVANSLNGLESALFCGVYERKYHFKISIY